MALSGRCPVVVRYLSGICQLFVASNIGFALLLLPTFASLAFSSEPACMRKKDWALPVLIITVLLLLFIVYFIFEKRIEAIPDMID